MPTTAGPGRRPGRWRRTTSAASWPWCGSRAASNPRQQAIPLALCRAEELLGGAGAVRVHGGGFAGTIQAFVPNGLLEPFLTGMEELLGRDMCHILAIRPEGGCLLAGEV